MSDKTSQNHSKSQPSSNIDLDPFANKILDMSQYATLEKIFQGELEARKSIQNTLKNAAAEGIDLSDITEYFDLSFLSKNQQ